MDLNILSCLALLTGAVLAILAVLHFYWAAGGSLGGGAAIPTLKGEKIFTPSAFASVTVGILLLLAMYAFLGRIGYLTFSFPGWLFRLGTALIAILFLLRAIGEFRYVGFFKSVKDSEFAWWDTYIFSPVCLLIAVSAFIISYFESADPR